MGLYKHVREIWKNPAGEVIPTFTVLTLPPNELMKGIHDRMPAILAPEQENTWLDNELPMKDLMQLIQPYPSDLMKAYRVSNLVNKVRINKPELLEEVPDFVSVDRDLAPPDALRALAEELSQYCTDWQVLGFGSTGHAFTNPKAQDQAGGMMFNERSSKRAWTALIGFLQSTLA